jgi:hypothetical protein
MYFRQSDRVVAGSNWRKNNDAGLRAPQHAFQVCASAFTLARHRPLPGRARLSSHLRTSLNVGE